MGHERSDKNIIRKRDSFELIPFPSKLRIVHLVPSPEAPVANLAPAVIKEVMGRKWKTTPEGKRKGGRERGVNLSRGKKYGWID